MNYSDILQDISVDLSYMVKKHLKNIKKLDSKKQRAFGKLFSDMKDGVDDLSEGVNESVDFTNEAFTSKLNTIRKNANNLKDFIKKTLADVEFKMFSGNDKFKVFLTDFYGVATESVNEVDTKKADTIRKSMPGYVGPKFAKKASDEDILAMADLKDEKAEIYNRYLKDVMGKISKLQKKYNIKE